MAKCLEICLGLSMLTLMVSSNISLVSALLYTNEPIRSNGTVNYSGSAGAILYNYAVIGTMDVNVLATYFDMAQIHHDSSPKIAQIHSINPNFKVLLYRNARATFTYWTDAFHEYEYNVFVQNNWFLRDRNGNVVISGGTDPMIDFGNSACQDWVANNVKNHLNEYDYAGVFLDNGLFFTTSGAWYSTSATPVNPRTNDYWTNTELVDAFVALHNKIKSAIGNKLLIVNGIFSGNQYNSQRSIIESVVSNSRMDGWMSEGWMLGTKPVWITETEWNYALELMSYTQSKGKFFVATACVNRELPSGATKTQMVLYGVATTMLGISSDKVYLHTTHTPEQYKSYYDLANSLGKPLGSHTISNGVYTRAFEYGKVYVNPSDVTRTSSEGVVMQAHTGKIVT